MTLTAVGGTLSTVGGTIAGLAGAFSPADLDPALWFDADAITGLVDGDPVQTWSDGSGNDRHATQATAAARPVYKTAMVNGLPAVRFDGVDDNLATPAFAQSTVWTAFVVVKRLSGTDVASLVDSDSSGGIRIAQHIRYANASNAGSVAFNTAGSPFPDEEAVTATSWSVLSAVRQPTAIAVFVNGTSGSSSATTGTPASGTQPVMLGRWLGDAIQHTHGDIAEIIYYPTALSTSDQADVRQYLGDKYGITVA